MTTDTNYPDLSLFIGDRRISSSERETIAAINPATGLEAGRIAKATSEDIDAAIRAAADAFETWSAMPGVKRSELLMNVADGLQARREEIARLITLDLGKPIAEARVEVDTAVGIWQWNAEEARRIYGRVIPSRTTGSLLYAVKEPLGPIAAFSTWNAPLITPSRKISSALAAGCTIIAKSASETPAPSVALMEAILDAGVPAGVTNLLFGSGAQISAKLLESPEIRGITFTGSTQLGRTLASQAVQGMKRATMELGGHAPVLVFADTDIEAVAKASVKAKYRNAGQVCTSPTRFLIEKPAYDEFVSHFVAEMKSIRLGDGMDTDTQMGPLAHAGRVAEIRMLTDDAREKGFRVEIGEAPEGAVGSYHPPVAIIGATPDCRAMSDEPFGPIALLAPFESIDEALAEANRLPVGLASYCFTTSTETTAEVARRMRAGNVIFNQFQASLPETPFGGIGDSGFGSEGGSEGVEAFTVTKYVSRA